MNDVPVSFSKQFCTRSYKHALSVPARHLAELLFTMQRCYHCLVAWQLLKSLILRLQLVPFPVETALKCLSPMSAVYHTHSEAHAFYRTTSEIPHSRVTETRKRPICRQWCLMLRAQTAYYLIFHKLIASWQKSFMIYHSYLYKLQYRFSTIKLFLKIIIF